MGFISILYRREMDAEKNKKDFRTTVPRPPKMCYNGNIKKETTKTS
jgi:hypothetical protein